MVFMARIDLKNPLQDMGFEETIFSINISHKYMLINYKVRFI